jgi:predicted phosphodiesterase
MIRIEESDRSESPLHVFEHLLHMPESELPSSDAFREGEHLKGYMKEALDQASLKYFLPKATFYFWVKAPKGISSELLAGALLDQAGIVVSPGSAYGPEGEGYIRFAMVVKDDRIKVVQLTDLHVSWWNSRKEIERIGVQVRELQPDLLLITGDVVDHNPDYVKVLADGLDQVRPRLGRYAIIGNHDVYTGREEITERMEARGFKMLRRGLVN